MTYELDGGNAVETRPERATMKQRTNKRLKFTLWVAIAMILVMMTAGVLFAAGEQLERGAVLSGGSTSSAGGFTLRSTAGLPVAGSDISSSSGAGLCSGFGCSSRSDSGPDDPGGPDDDVKLYMPKLRRQN